MNKETHIFDPIQNKLDAKIFRGTTPKSTVVKFIDKKINSVFKQELGFDVSKIIHLYLTGSLTTYQYHDTSDVDINIFVDYNKWPVKMDASKIRKKLISIILDKINGINLPDTEHPLQVFVLPEGILPIEHFDVGLRSAWSFDKKQWLVKPEKDRVIDVVNDTSDVYVKAMRIAEQMEMLLEENPKGAKDLYKKIYKKRQKDQKMFGDFSEGNIIYKFLDFSGYFDKLKKLDVKIAEILKEADFSDVMKKAKDYIENGRFSNIINNRYDDGRSFITAVATGEDNPAKRRLPQTGSYYVEVKMEDLNNPFTVTSWSCDCPWGQVSWGRTRQWKKYEGRVCCHALGLYWIWRKQPDAFTAQLDEYIKERLPQETPEQIEQDLAVYIEDMKVRDDAPFKQNDVIALKPGELLSLTNPSNNQVRDIKGGTRGKIMEYDAETNQIWVSFDNDWGGQGEAPTFDPMWIDANKVYLIEDTTQLPTRRTNLIIKEAKEPPVIYEIT